jgi:hypothetical protein
MNTYNIYIYSPSNIYNTTTQKNIEQFGKEYSFTTLTNEHLTKLLLLQKINKSANRITIITIYLDDDIDIDDFQDKLHPKLFTILKYHSINYGIFIKKINE